MKRRDVEARLALYDDLSDILRAMRSFALAELHRVTRREEAQQAVVAALSNVVDELAAVWPAATATQGDVLILFGSVRGFCGTYNEDVARTWRLARTDAPTVVVGERLVGLMPEAAHRYSVAGALGALDAPAAIDRILAAVGEARHSLRGREAGLVACVRDKDGARCQRLLPLALRPGQTGRPLPLMQEPADRLVTRVAEHYLSHALLALMLQAVRTENQMRLMQMENALRHIERSTDELQRWRNRLRQEEIVEEIEVMVTKRTDLQPGLRNRLPGQEAVPGR